MNTSQTLAALISYRNRRERSKQTLKIDVSDICYSFPATVIVSEHKKINVTSTERRNSVVLTSHDIPYIMNARKRILKHQYSIG